MKKIALVLSVIASAMILSSCASQGSMSPGSATMTDSSASQTAAAPAHRDYKGEVGK